MKKLALFAAAMTAGAALADVTSANCVGYMTTAIGSGKLQMMTVPFNHVGNDGKGLMLNSDLKVANPKMADDWSQADQIWVWVPANEAYKKFYFYDGEYGTGWCETTGDENFFEDCAGYENGLPPGSSFFFNAKAGSGKNIVFKKTF